MIPTISQPIFILKKKNQKKKISYIYSIFQTLFTSRFSHRKIASPSPTSTSISSSNRASNRHGFRDIPKKKEFSSPCFYSHNFYSHSDNRFRHFRTDLYLGDDPISTVAGEEKAARDRVRARKRIGELKKRRKAKERRQRMRHGGEKSAVESPPASPRVALNETIMSRLDLSCIMKARRKGFTKAPPVENAYPAKYARFVHVSTSFRGGMKSHQWFFLISRCKLLCKLWFYLFFYCIYMCVLLVVLISQNWWFLWLLTKFIKFTRKFSVTTFHMHANSNYLTI